MKMTGGRCSWLVRAAGLAAVGLFLVLVARFWHPVYRLTSFIQLDASNDDLKIQAFRELPIYVYRTTGGYDGLFYAQIAYDPTLRSPELISATDSLAYRGRRILPPALAWLLAAGQPSLIVHVYSLLNVAAWLALAALLWRILAVQDWRSWLGWAAVLFSAGALGSVRLALTDLIALVILAGGVFAAERNRERSGAGLVALAGLARETSLLALGGVIRRPWFTRENFLRALFAVAPLALWLLYLRGQLGGLNPGWGNFALPGVGLIGKWKDSLQAIAQGNPDHVSLAWTALLATAGLSVQLLFLATHRAPGDRWWCVGALYALMMLFLGNAVWEGFPGAFTRVLLPLALAFNVLAVRRRAALPWLLAGNLAVAAGIQMFLQPPTDPAELAAARSHGIGIVAQTESGWYGVEHTSRHRWSWSSGHGKLQMKTWPAMSSPWEFRGVLRSVAPCRVTVSQSGVVLWRGESGTAKTEFNFPFTVHEGRSELEFATDSPGVPESSSPDARRLAFAVYDARLSVPKK
jgi:hypothetical protein